MVHIVTPYMKRTSPCFQGVMKYVMVDASLLLITTVLNLCRCLELRIGTIVFSFIFLPQNGEPLEWRLSNKQIQISLKRRAVATFQNLMLRKITLNRVKHVTLDHHWPHNSKITSIADYRKMYDNARDG